MLDRTPVPGFEQRYEIDRSGSVFSKKSGLKIKVKIRNRGYSHVALYNGVKTRMIRLHRLVALAFIPNPKGYGDVNHLDGNKSNNSVENLEWCNRSQNMLHAYRIGLRVAAGCCVKRVKSPTPCCVAGCLRLSASKGLCGPHYSLDYYYRVRKTQKNQTERTRI